MKSDLVPIVAHVESSLDVIAAIELGLVMSEVKQDAKPIVSGKLISGFDDCSVARGASDPFMGDCPAWCDDMHTVMGSREDRWHMSDGAMLPLSLEDMSYYPSDKPGGKSVYSVSTLHTWLQQHDAYRDAEVAISVKGSKELKLTIAEAETLAHALLNQVAQARL